MVKNPSYDYAGAKAAGHSDDEILSFLSEKYPKYDVKAAKESGHTTQEINEYLASYKPERSIAAQAGRAVMQYGLGRLESTAPVLAYDIASAHLASPQAANVAYRENVMEDLENMAIQKASGRWTPEDEQLFQNLQEQIGDVEKSAKFAQTMDVSARGLIEKATGLDLHPEGIIEKGAHWLGFIQHGPGWKDLVKIGANPKEIIKAIIPSATETLRGVTAGTALEMAEQNNFGPLGTIASAIVGDLIGFVPKALTYAVKNPKQVLAGAVNLLTGANSKGEWTKQLIDDAEKAGIQLDAGSITNSNLVRMLQARAAQSSLSGNALDNFRKELSNQVIRQYETALGDLGTLAFENQHQAAEAVRNFVRNEERTLFERYGEGERAEGRSLKGRITEQPRPDPNEILYHEISPNEFSSDRVAGNTLKAAAQDAKAPIKAEFDQRWEDFRRRVSYLEEAPEPTLARFLENFVEDNRGSLLLGESSAENGVVQAATRLRDELMNEEGSFIGVTVEELMQTKRTLGDIADWEFGGGNFESAYKKLIEEIDSAIRERLNEVDSVLGDEFAELNRDYANYKNTFENKNVMPLFEPKNRNYSTIYNQILQNPDKMTSVEAVLAHSREGEQLTRMMKRDYAQRILEKPNVTDRQLRNLESVLGPEYEQMMDEYAQVRRFLEENPRPRAAQVEGVNVRPGAPTRPRSMLEMMAPQQKKYTVRTKPEHARQKLYEYIKNKDSTQIMKMMDSIDGIRRLERALRLTPEGEGLFKQLSRYKLYELIDKKMTDSLEGNLKLGTFSGLLKDTKSQSIVKELVGKDAFDKIQRLQRISGKMQASMDKFYNYSKSGTTVVDTTLACSAVLGLFTGNPYMLLNASAGLGGMRMAANLLADPVFLKHLEKAVLTNNQGKFLEILEQMRPHVNRAIVRATLDEQEG